MPEAQKPEELTSAVDELVASIKASTARLADAGVPSGPQVTQPQAPTVEQFTAKLNETAQDGKNVGGAVTEGLQQVVPAVLATQAKTAAGLQRKLAKQDAEIGPLMKRFEKQINERIKREGISDFYLAENGFETLARAAAADDPTYQTEIAEQRAKKLFDEYVAKMTPSPPAPAAPRPPVETPASVSAAGAAPAAPPSEEEAIRAIELTPEEIEEGRRFFHMTPGDIKKQRHEIRQMYKKYGEFGIRQLGGVPVCSLEAVGLPEGN